MQIIETDDSPAEMFRYVHDNMSPEDIKRWLKETEYFFNAYANACGEAVDELSDKDRDILSIGNAFLYTLGACRAYGLDNKDNMN